MGCRPLNRVTMLTDYIAPEQRSVATANQDVVYGTAFFSLEKEPVVAAFQCERGSTFWFELPV